MESTKKKDRCGFFTLYSLWQGFTFNIIYIACNKIMCQVSLRAKRAPCKHGQNHISLVHCTELSQNVMFSFYFRGTSTFQNKNIISQRNFRQRKWILLLRKGSLSYLMSTVRKEVQRLWSKGNHLRQRLGLKNMHLKNTMMKSWHNCSHRPYLMF